MMKICFSYLKKLGGEAGTLRAADRKGGLVLLEEEYAGARAPFML